MENDAGLVAAHVDAAAAVFGMPLKGERRAAVVAAMTRLYAFAADVATVELGPEAEIAGAVEP
jgi:hypothetical protein